MIGFAAKLALGLEPMATSALDPAGPADAHWYSLWTIYLGISTAVMVLVLAALAWAVLRRRTAETANARLVKPVATATAVAVVVLGVLLFCSIATGRALSAMKPSDISIEVIGQQWWWEIRVAGARAQDTVVDANEIHVPVGTPVKLKLSSHDVIHSFWVPALGGKRDLTPGHETVLVIQADHEGTYVGQCAEYCGAQHANMRIVVVAQPPDAYARWLENARSPARTPSTRAEQRGLETFVKTRCATCHGITGTDAYGAVAPDLTHFASRKLIAATVPNTHEQLREWIRDPQLAKPGNHMPINALSPEELDDLTAYLESLK